MKVPLSFLKEYIDINLPIESIAEKLTDGGIEVDSISHPIASFQNVVVAEVLSTEPHPNADRLTIAKVSDGKETFRVVCGAKNCRPNIHVAFAKIGAFLTDEKNDRFNIKKASIRSIESEGMLCSEKELGLSQEHEGILELDFSIPLGTDLFSYFFEPILEISLTPNLSRCLGVIGIARELSAITNIPMKIPPSKVTSDFPFDLSVEIKDFNICPRYSARIIQNLPNIKTPFWLKHRLEQCGQKCVNPIVDVLNYVMLELNQPMHGFDLDTIEGKKIIVDKTKKEEHFLGLDQIERIIPKDSIVIKDANKILALAGILGGSSSSITNSTKSILLESAYFAPTLIRVTKRKLSLSTESSMRFERETDPNTTLFALDRAAFLFQKISPIKVSENIDVKKEKFLPKKLTLNIPFTNQILGTVLSQSEIEEIFKRLDCVVKSKNESLELQVPTYRQDIVEEIDLVEEVARIYGYNNIERKAPLIHSSSAIDNSYFSFETILKEILISASLQEIITCSLISPEMAKNLHGFPEEDIISLLHSKSKDQSLLRPTLLTSFLEVIKYNLDQKNLDLKIFETSNVHMKKEKDFLEFPVLAVALSGNRSKYHFQKKPLPLDFYDLKEVFEILFSRLKIEGISFTSSSFPNFHPFRQSQLFHENKDIGVIGEIHPQMLESLDIKQKVFFGEINLKSLLSLIPKSWKPHPLPTYPSIERDWTLPIPIKSHVGLLLSFIRSIDSSILKKVSVLDLYSPNAKEKHLTLRFVYRSDHKTLLNEDVEKEHQKILDLTSQEMKNFF